MDVFKKRETTMPRHRPDFGVQFLCMTKCMANGSAMKVTYKNIKTLPVGQHRVDKCLYVRIRENRAPIWVLIYSINQKRTQMSLGLVDEISISEAKTLAEKYRGMISQGIDPAKARKARRAENAMTKPEIYTFSQLLEDSLPVITKTKRWKNEKHAHQWAQTLTDYALPILKDRDVSTINRDDILEVLKPIWETKTDTAKRLRGRLEALFGFAIATGKRLDANPCVWRGNLDLFLPPPSRVKPVQHHDSVPVYVAKTLFDDWRPPQTVVQTAILFGVLTCARVNEFVPAKWREIDFKNRVWICPPQRRKDQKPYPHRVPLSKQAIMLLKTLSYKKDGYIFTGRLNGHISKESPRAIILRRLGFGTMHGFRSTFRDWAAENGIDQVLAEKSLMHATGNEVEQAYQRSDLLEQRRPVLQAWADAIYPILDDEEKKD